MSYSATSVRRLGPEDWQLYRRVRLDALKEAPYAFGSTYEREVEFDDATWRRRGVDRVPFIAEGDGVVAGAASGGGRGGEGGGGGGAVGGGPPRPRVGGGGM